MLKFLTMFIGLCSAFFFLMMTGVYVGRFVQQRLKEIQVKSKRNMKQVVKEISLKNSYITVRSFAFSKAHNVYFFEGEEIAIETLQTLKEKVEYVVYFDAIIDWKNKQVHGKEMMCETANSEQEAAQAIKEYFQFLSSMEYSEEVPI